MSRPPETSGYKVPQGAGDVPLTACVVDLARERVMRDDAVVSLTARETRLLRYLWEREGKDVSREELLVEVWGYSRRARSRAVDATVQRLRAKLERDPTAPDHLRTVWGNGYRFVAAAPRIASTRDHLLGRDTETRAVTSTFAEGARLVTLTGPSESVRHAWRKR